MRSRGLLVLIAVLVLAVLASVDVARKCADESCPLTKSWLESIESPSAPAGATYDVAMDLPLSMRTENYSGGSCVHASNVSLLRWQGQDEMADWWRKTYGGGEYDTRLVSRMEAAGLRYAYTKTTDMHFLRWCVRTRRGAGIFYKPRHSINVVGMDEKYVYLLDNNYVDYPEQYGHYERVAIGEFEQRWNGYGGFAWTLVYQPPPPLPHL